MDSLGAITTSVTTHQAGVATVTATYEVKDVTVRHHRSTVRTVSKAFGSVQTNVRNGTTVLVLKPTAAALRTLRGRGSLDVAERVTVEATGLATASDVWHVHVRVTR